jgi:CHAT domain-containing protein
LFQELLAPIPEIRTNSRIIVVPDGALHLMPFAALAEEGQYLIANRTINKVPSATVFDILHHREAESISDGLPYVGVAAWTKSTATTYPILRGFSNLILKDLGPLPKSQEEVQNIANDLPKPSTLLIGDDATETHFKQLPLDKYNILHLALHGYADKDYPDQSALVFAPQRNPTDDGLLQIDEIRKLRLKASLVTLSACDTGVGPVGESGVENLSNAFIEAGANSVLSTLWDLEDSNTLHLMEIFYRRLAAHETKAEALRDAQLDVLQAGLPPYYWASFELIGNASRTL